MPGFYISSINEVQLKNAFDEKCSYEAISYVNYYCARNTINKFMEDKAFVDYEDSFVVLDGYLLNKKDLLRKYSVNDVGSLMMEMYRQEGDQFFRDFRGSFSGALYDKSADKWIIFTNHYGDKGVFYYWSPGIGFTIGSQPNYVVDSLKASGVTLSVNRRAVYSMLTYAFMYDDFTYVQEIKRLTAGQYLVIESGSMSKLTYYSPKGRAHDLSELSYEDIIEQLDLLFVEAVKLEFEKDNEYGLAHICDLSGGLDSRMTTWVASKHGYKPMLNICYSQTGYSDELIASAIASHLGNEMLFKPLDDAGFLFEAEKLVSMNYGTALYPGITGGESLLRNLNFDCYGLEHTGQLGDVVVGTFLKDASSLNVIEHAGMYSKQLSERLEPLQKKSFLDREQQLMKTRGFQGALSTHFIRQNYTEVASPFINIDFFDYCLSIPVEIRAKHSLYKDWIRLKYPEAATFPWEKSGAPLNANVLGETLAKCSRYSRLAMSRLRPASKQSMKSSMNPFDYWFATIPRVELHIDRLFRRIDETGFNQQLVDDCSLLFKHGSAMEKTQVITAILGALYYQR